MKIAVFAEPLESPHINKRWDEWLLTVNDGKPFAVVSLVQQIILVPTEKKRALETLSLEEPCLCAVLTYVPQSQTGIVGATLGTPANGVRA